MAMIYLLSVIQGPREETDELKSLYSGTFSTTWLQRGGRNGKDWCMTTQFGAQDNRAD